MLRSRIVLWIVMILLAATPACSQPDLLQFARLDINDGLSHNQVNCFYKDRTGFIWIGTLSGLNRFDGYSFKVFRNNARDSTSIPYNDVRQLFEDPNGRIWLITNNGTCAYDPAQAVFIRQTDTLLHDFSIPPGNVLDIKRDSRGTYWFMQEAGLLYTYNPKTHHTEAVRYDTTGINVISDLAEDQEGNFWMVCRNGTIMRLNGGNHRVTYRNDGLSSLYPATNERYWLKVDNDNDVWVYSNDNTNRGVFYFDEGNRKWQHLTTESASGVVLNNNIVRDLEVSDDGVIWIATDHGGINLIDKKRGTVRYVRNDAEDLRSLSQNSVNTLYKDNEGIMWIGTFKKGLNYYHENITKFGLYRHQSSKTNSLPYDDVNRFEEDKAGNLWIGTNGGGLIYFDRSANTFRQYLHDPSDPNSLTNNVIVSLEIDHKNKLWIGTYFGGLDCYDGKKFTHFRHTSDQGSLADDNVWEIIEDVQHNLWIGTLTGGLDKLGPERKTFEHYRIPEGILSTYVPELLEDHTGTVWVGTGYGLSMLDRNTGLFTNIVGDGSPGALSSNNVTAIYEDEASRIWIGTQDGLNLFDPRSRAFKTFREEDGLAHNTILDILEDDGHNLWISTPNGLSKLIIQGDPQQPEFEPLFKNYDERDGLQGKQFNESAACRTTKGELVFGGANGFNLFDPHEIRVNQSAPPVVLIDFLIHNNSIKVGERIGNSVIIDQSITRTSSLTLHHKDNVFSIEFAALSFLHPEKNDYKYILEGFNKEWVNASGQSRRVTYTNLDPGDYTFRVIASNSDGIWNEHGAELAITVLPPFWKTGWAFVMYLVVIFGALLLARKLLLDRERMKFRIEQERHEGQRIHELDMMKIKFITNVSHEFRTPLSLILTPLEKMMKENDDQRLTGSYSLIHRNARRLLSLVNQLLDFRRMELDEVTINTSEGDIVGFIHDTVKSFSDLSDKKSIALTFETGIEHLETVFDQDKLEKILFNLLSNAFKFTHEGGSIKVNVALLSDDVGGRALEIRVIDTGIGIPSEKRERIFERFFQNELPGKMVNQGSGIGLSITREFVRIHGGTIEVESTPGSGSCFIVTLPVKEITHAVDAEGAVVKDSVSDDRALAERATSERPRKKPVVLLIEDNEDFRFYLKDNLKSLYEILEAGDGERALKIALSEIPDLIVCDIMIPGPNGLEVCRNLRNNVKTSHVPIILLTARSSVEQKQEGYAVGADDYITKPFNFEILISRIRNLIELRSALHEAFRKKIDIRASEINVTSLDEKLIQKAIKAVEESLANPDFSVEELSRGLGMSRVHLYKKLLALTGKSPLEFIRTIRLQRAAQLLKKSQLTVAEIAYQVGFNNPKYFAKYFKEEYNTLPSQYAGKVR